MLFVVSAIDTDVDNDISVLSLLQSCRFNKNGQDMSGVCNRIQVNIIEQWFEN